MTTCIKCGRPIADGELFCVECDLNPEIDTTAAPRPSAPHGRMQQPSRTAPQPASARVAAPVKTAPAPAPAKPVKKHTGLIIALCLVTLLSLGFAISQVAKDAQRRVELRLRESDLEARERQMSQLEQSVNDLNAKLDDANATIQEQTQALSDLQTSYDNAQSTATQAQYDVTAKESELERLTEENAQLAADLEDLKTVNEDLAEENASLSEKNAALFSKASFMDDYVVFVNNNKSKLYHRYDCPSFSHSNFWAYSRKLAEASGFDPCPDCCG